MRRYNRMILKSWFEKLEVKNERDEWVPAGSMEDPKWNCVIKSGIIDGEEHSLLRQTPWPSCRQLGCSSIQMIKNSAKTNWLIFSHCRKNVAEMSSCFKRDLDIRLLKNYRIYLFTALYSNTAISHPVSNSLQSLQIKPRLILFISYLLPNGIEYSNLSKNPWLRQLLPMAF